MMNRFGTRPEIRCSVSRKSDVRNRFSTEVSGFIFRGLVLTSIVSLWSGGNLSAATTTEVTVAIGKGSQYLQQAIQNAHAGKKTLAALALYKAGVPKESAVIQDALNEVLKKFEGGRYRPGGEHFYEAGVEATLLADFDPEKYRPQLTLLRDYIVQNQQENGGWDYPNGGHGPDSVGDTSLIQYCCLGLWAVERAGLKVDPRVWEKVLNWHTRYQGGDGGFAYCPGLMAGDGQGKPTLNMTVNAVGSMHIAMLQLSPSFLPLEQNRPEKKPAADGDGPVRPKFGILEQVEIDTRPKEDSYVGTIPNASIASVRKAHDWVVTRFRPENKETGNRAYYYYSLERMAALANLQNLGGRDWFNECADVLIKSQAADGSWAMSQYYGPEVDTAFIVLFLTRSTGRLLKRTVEPQVGGGTLAGGRGLPDDLSDVDFNGRQVKGKEPPKEPLDKLLASLMNTGEIDIADVQDQIIEQVQIGDRKELIGQIDRLIKLVDHPEANVRQTVVWAIGRTDNLELARHLIDALSDRDLGVMIEAQNALCWISRKPLGFGLPQDPIEELPPNATAQQKRDAITDWHRKAVLAWGQWYLQNRPFRDRGDEFEAILRAKLERLKEGVALR